MSAAWKAFDLLISPEALAAFLIALMAFIFLFLFPRKMRLRSRTLIAHFGGKFVWPFGPVEFFFQKTKMRILEMASGGGASGVGGSFPTLWCYVKSTDKMILGHAGSGAFTRGQFLFLPPHVVAEVAGTPFLIGGSKLNAAEDIRRRLLQKPAVSQSLSSLFPNRFDHLTIATEMHLGGPTLLSRRTVLRYSVLPRTLYSAPESLEPKLRQISDLMDALGIEPEEG